MPQHIIYPVYIEAKILLHIYFKNSISGILFLFSKGKQCLPAQHYVLHDLKSFADKYVKAWNNMGVRFDEN